jgi:hypothetical protein
VPGNPVTLTQSNCQQPPLKRCAALMFTARLLAQGIATAPSDARQEERGNETQKKVLSSFPERPATVRHRRLSKHGTPPSLHIFVRSNVESKNSPGQATSVALCEA